MRSNPLNGVKVQIGKRTTLGQAFDALVTHNTPLFKKMEEAKQRGREQYATLPKNKRHKL